MTDTAIKLNIIPFPLVSSSPLPVNHVILRSPATIVTVHFSVSVVPAIIEPLEDMETTGLSTFDKIIG